MNKRNKLTRNSKHSQSELIQKADKFINFSVRDFVALALFGLTQLLIDDTKKLRDEFELLPSDEEILAEKTAATGRKNLAFEELRSAIKAILRRIALHFGKNGPEMKKAGGENLSNMTDAEFCQKGRRVERVGREYAEILQAEGLTVEMLDNLKAKTDAFDNLLDELKDLTVQRDIKTQERVGKANDLYNAIVKLSEIGKATFEETDPSRYEGYKINDKSAKRSKTNEGEVENEEVNEE